MSYTNGLDDPTIFFNTKLYTGNDTGSTGITGVGFQPDWVWIKSRNGAYDNNIFDSVRGAEKQLVANGTNAEQTLTDSFNSFDSDGFTLGADSQTDGVNNNGTTYASWNWKAGGSASSNSNGSITSTVSANQTAGFSIVSYTSGQSGVFSIGHGLSSAPKIFIAKSRDSTNNWGFYYTVRGTNTNWLTLDTNDAQGNNNADPDANGIAGGGVGYTGVYAVLNSSTISIGPTAYANSGTSAIGYCFAEVKGFSKFGSYTGNGSTDGTFVYTGFKPAWLMIKSSSLSSTSWVIHDNKRDTFNIAKNNLDADNSDAEANLDRLDILSNGFKSRSTLNFNNRSGETYIYMAFAESPFVNSSGIPNNAR